MTDKDSSKRLLLIVVGSALLSLLLSLALLTLATAHAQQLSAQMWKAPTTYEWPTPPPRIELMRSDTLSENIEDRRDEPEFADYTLKKIWAAPSKHWEAGLYDVAPQARVYYNAGMARRLGFGDVGKLPRTVQPLPFQKRPLSPFIGTPKGLPYAVTQSNTKAGARVSE